MLTRYCRIEFEIVAVLKTATLSHIKPWHATAYQLIIGCFVVAVPCGRRYMPRTRPHVHPVFATCNTLTCSSHRNPQLSLKSFFLIFHPILVFCSPFLYSSIVFLLFYCLFPSSESSSLFSFTTFITDPSLYCFVCKIFIYNLFPCDFFIDNFFMLIVFIMISLYEITSIKYNFNVKFNYFNLKKISSQENMKTN